MMYLTRLKENFLVNFRILFYFVAFVHLAFTAVVTLSIDTTVDSDPKIRAYFYVRWLLLTCWFNLITLGYLPTRLYCDWKTLRSAGKEEHVVALRKITDVVMTSILAPTTFFADILFWPVFLTNPSLMAPVLLFDYMPGWAHHSLHTVSLVVIVIDLVVNPRKKPRSMTLHVGLMTAFIFIYLSVVWYFALKGVAAYAYVEFMTTIQKVFTTFAIYVSYLVIFKLQWLFIESIWRTEKYNQ